jgi:hypothetical protein
MNKYHVAAGPWLVWKKNTEIIELPRNGLTICISDVISFEVYSYYKEYGGEIQGVSELYVLVKKNNGSIERLPLVGSTLKRATFKMAFEIGKLMNILVEENPGTATNKNVNNSEVSQ